MLNRRKLDANIFYKKYDVNGQISSPLPKYSFREKSVVLQSYP